MDRGKIVVIDSEEYIDTLKICQLLSESENWILIPNIIQICDGFPDENDEMNHQKQRLNMELNKIERANQLASTGQNVIIERSFISTLTSSYAIEQEMGFVGTFEHAMKLYNENYLEHIGKNNYTERDRFIFLTSEDKNGNFIKYQRAILKHHISLEKKDDADIIDVFGKSNKDIIRELSEIIRKIKLEPSNQK